MRELILLTYEGKPAPVRTILTGLVRTFLLILNLCRPFSPQVCPLRARRIIMKVLKELAWWHTPVISALGRLRQEDREFKASLA
jgi:hypothetical protein